MWEGEEGEEEEENEEEEGTYSFTVSLGMLVGKAVRPLLLQSTVELRQTHLSGQAEAMVTMVTMVAMVAM